MKKKLRKKLALGTAGLGNTDPVKGMNPEQQKIYDQYNKSLESSSAYLKSKFQNPIFLQRAANELALSNQMENSGLVQPYPKGYEKQWAQEKIENLDDYEFNLLKELNLFSENPGVRGVVDTKLYNDNPNMIYQKTGNLANKFTVPISHINKTVAINPNISFSDNLVNSASIHELAHISNAARKGYNNPYNRLLGTVTEEDNTKFDVMGQEYNSNPYALKVIKQNTIPDPDNYFSKPTEVESGKRQVEYLLENAPEGVFSKPWKYGDEVDETHWDYIHNPQKYSKNPNDFKNEESDMMLKAIYGKDKFNQNRQLEVTDEEKKAKFKNFKELMKLAQQEQVNPLDIQTAAYGGTIQSNMKKKNKNIQPQLPQMGFGGKLAPMLFDIGSNALMNLTGYAITDLVKTIRDGEQEQRPTKMNTGFVMANGGMVPNVPVEVEGGEHYEMPNGQVGQFQGPSHEQGGIPTALPEGTKVYSDRIEIKGKTMSERKSQRERNIAKLEKLLGKNPSDKFLKETYNRVKETAAMEEQKDMAIQEQVNQQQAQQEQQMMAGLMQDPAMMQQMGMMMYGGTLPKLNNGTPPKGLSPSSQLYTGFGSYPKYYYQYNTANNDNAWSYYNPDTPDKGWIQVDPKTNVSAFNTLNKSVLNNPKYFVGDNVMLDKNNALTTTAKDARLDIFGNVNENESVNSMFFEKGMNPFKGLPLVGKLSSLGKPYFDEEAYNEFTNQDRFSKRYQQNKLNDVEGTNPPQPIISENHGMKIAGEWTKDPNAEPSFPFVIGGREKPKQSEEFLPNTALSDAVKGTDLTQQTPLIHKNINSPYDLMNHLMFEALQNPDIFGYSGKSGGGGAGGILGDTTENSNTSTGKGGKKQNALTKLAEALTGKGDGVKTAGSKKGKGSKSGESTDGSSYDFTRGDLMGLAGNIYGAMGPMASTFLNRMETPKNINFFREYGAEGLRAMQEAQGMLGAAYNQQKEGIKMSEEASRKRGRASARGVNTLRGLDIAADTMSNQAYNQALANYMGQTMGILGQKAQMENQQDKMVMQGETARDLADRQDVDNFYTNLATNLASQSELMQKTGRDLNQKEMNNLILQMSPMFSRYGIGVSMKNGKAEFTWNGKKIDETQAQQIVTQGQGQEKKTGTAETVNPIMPMDFMMPKSNYNFGDTTIGKISPLRKTKKRN